MTLFIQGMRRSGTTILYDALVTDPGLHCFYEPFREEKDTPGGGSGARQEDPFSETRGLRAAYAAEVHPELSLDQFNWGGPRRPRLELEPNLPAHCRGFLDSLLRSDGSKHDPGAGGTRRPWAGEVAIKFTRMSAKIADLKEADPGALLIHMVRDPRAVAASMMHGRGSKREGRYPEADQFFSETEKRKLWSSGPLSDALGARLSCPNHERILMVWKENFDSTHVAGQRLFGERYLLVQNEQLRVDTLGVLRRIYAARGIELPAAVAEWAAGKVKPLEQPYSAEDRRWAEALRRLDAGGSVAAAGYPELAEAVAAAGPARLAAVARWRRGGKR